MKELAYTHLNKSFKEKILSITKFLSILLMRHIAQNNLDRSFPPKNPIYEQKYNVKNKNLKFSFFNSLFLFLMR